MIMADELKEKIRKSGYTIPEFSRRLGIDASTFHRKIKAGGDGFSVGEVKRISEILSLTGKEINCIFFGDKVA